MPGMSGRKATGISAVAVFCCCLVCCAIPGIVALVVLNQEFSDWPVVDAVVVGTTFCSGGDSSSESTYSVRYNFTTLEGDQIVAETDYCHSPVPDIGETDQIRYDPDDPSSILEEDLLDIGFIAAKAAAGVGWACVAIGLCVAAFTLTRPKPNDNNQTTISQPYSQPNGPAGDYSVGQQPVAFHTNIPSAAAAPYSQPNGPAGDYSVGQQPVAFHTNIPSAAAAPYSQPNGPAGDFGNSLGGQEHPSATATPVTYNAYGQPVVYNGNVQPAQVYGGTSQPASSGPATYYK
jgi:hypothetical protein